MLLSVDQVARIESLLQCLSSSDNATRTQAEKELYDHWIKTSPDGLLVALCQLASSSTNPLLGNFSCVLARRLYFKSFSVPSTSTNKGTVWNTLDASIRDNVKTILINSFFNLSLHNHVKNSLADLMAEIARSCHGNWPALLDSILASITNGSLSVATIRIISTYPLLIRTLSSGVLKNFFSSILNDSSSNEILTESIKAYVSFMDSISNESSIRNSLIPIMGHVLLACRKLFNSQSDALLLESISSLSELAEESPKVFKDSIRPLVDLLTEIVFNSSETFDDSTRQGAVELYVTLCENIPGVMKKAASADNHRMLRIIFERMLPDVKEEEEDWFNCETLEESCSSEENYAVAEQAIDRISLSLGGLHVLPVAFEIIPKFIKSTKWEERRGALMSIAYLAEGCSSVLEEHLDGIMDMVFASFQDPNQRVRYAACHALGQLCTDFQETLQQKYHYRCAQCLMEALSNPPSHPRVQAHAASALVNFCDGCDQEILKNYLDGFIERLIRLISSNKIYAQEQAVVTLSVIADVCMNEFQKYYGSIMPILVQIVKNAKDQNYRSLRAKTLDSATVIGVAVARELFLPQAKEIVDEMIELQKNATSDDPVQSILPSCWVRICRIFENEFNPLMELVWPSVMQRARLEPDIALLDADAELSEEQQGDDWEFANIHGKKIGIRTSTLEEKCAAVENIEAYAEILKKSFAPYCGDVLKLLIELFSFDLHDGVKIASVSAVFPVFRCLLDAGNEKGMDVSLTLNQWYPVLKELLDSASGHDCSDGDFICQVFDTLGQCILLFGSKAFASIETLSTVVSIMEDLLKEITTAIKEFELESSEDDSCEADEESIQNEENVLIEMSKLIRNCMQIFTIDFVHLFKNSLSTFSQGLTSSRSVVRHVSICVFSDLVEFAGPTESWNYAGLFCEHFFKSILDPTPEVRQAAAFAIGICAVKGGPSYLQLCQASLPKFFEMAQLSDSRKHDNILATENAISCIAKILASHPALEDEDIIVKWIHLLPVSNDEEEHEFVYQFLLQSLKRYSFYTRSLDEASFVVKELVNACTMSHCSILLKQHLSTFLDQFLANCPVEARNSILSGISRESLNAIPFKLMHF